MLDLEALQALQAGFGSLDVRFAAVGLLFQRANASVLEHAREAVREPVVDWLVLGVDVSTDAESRARGLDAKTTGVPSRREQRRQASQQGTSKWHNDNTHRRSAGEHRTNARSGRQAAETDARGGGGGAAGAQRCPLMCACTWGRVGTGCACKQEAVGQ